MRRDAHPNAPVDVNDISEESPALAAGRELLLRATERMHLTARGWHRVLRVARTIADLDGHGEIARPHIAEALSFRRIAPDRR